MQLPGQMHQNTPFAHCAFATPLGAATNLQHDIDQALQQVLARVGEAQAAAGSGAPGLVVFESGSLPPLDLYRPVSLACTARLVS